MDTSLPSVRRAYFLAFRGECFWSGRTLSEDAFEIDHVVPVAKGGEDHINNLVLADPLINKMKRDSMDIEKLERILYIIETTFAPRVRKYLAEEERKLLGRRYVRPPARESPNEGKVVRTGSEEDFALVWGVSAKTFFDKHIRKTWKPIAP